MIVTVGIIAYNEEKNISALLENLLSQTYAHDKMELILVDGKSTDNTKNILQEFARQYNNEFLNIKVLDNPKRVQSAGWNVVIANTGGDLIIRVDAHSTISNNFVEKNVKCIESGEDVCGGTMVLKANSVSKLSKAILAAETSMFGGSPANFKRIGTKEYVKTLAMGCYKKEIFDKVGNFNENLLRSEDNEMHYRIRRNGYKLCLSGDISYEYLVRPTLKGATKQKYGNGKWIGLTSFKLTPGIFSLYHFIPMLFVLGMLACVVTALIGIALPQFALWFAMPLIVIGGAYIMLLAYIALGEAVKNKSFLQFILLPWIICLLHISYGVGTIIGVVMAPFKKFK